MNDLVNGTYLTPHQELCILNDIEWRLEAEVNWQNQLLRSKESHMREVKQLTGNLRDMMANIKKSALQAQSEFQSEGQRALDNAEKVHAVATELKDANKELEQLLGETGSNFSPTEGSSHTSEHLINGVTLHKG
jgi:hypothetical protein